MGEVVNGWVVKRNNRGKACSACGSRPDVLFCRVGSCVKLCRRCFERRNRGLRR